jgi:hypothetical protein
MELFHICRGADIEKSPSDLVIAARQAAIHTFGWPIGLVLENNPDGRPRPISDGIFAEIHSIDGAYDYWALGREGQFYSLMSLFEDERAERKLFFDTRIVRVTEAIMHAINLYKALGAELGAMIELVVVHSGLEGRTLAAASPYRHPLFKKRGSVENSITSPTVQFSVGVDETEITRLVITICAPLFELFDFERFDESIYTGIVSHFLRGKVT